MVNKMFFSFLGMPVLVLKQIQTSLIFQISILNILTRNKLKNLFLISGIDDVEISRFITIFLE